MRRKAAGNMLTMPIDVPGPATVRWAANENTPSSALRASSPRTRGEGAILHPHRHMGCRPARKTRQRDSACEEEQSRHGHGTYKRPRRCLRNLCRRPGSQGDAGSGETRVLPAARPRTTPVRARGIIPGCFRPTNGPTIDERARFADSRRPCPGCRRRTRPGWRVVHADLPGRVDRGDVLRDDPPADEAPEGAQVAPGQAFPRRRDHIAGTVAEIGDNFVTVEIADGVKVRVQKAAVGNVLPKGTLKSAV